MAECEFDIIIVGGGIHGAAVARQAVDRNLKTLVLEQFSGPAQGTSSRSSKLVHGGLRYLESFSFGLVHECLMDRRRLLQDYPDLVTMQKFFIPIYKSTSRTRLELRLGLSLYGLLGGLDRYSRFATVPKSQWHTLDGLRTDDLLAVFQYWDGQTDDRKLTARLLEESLSRNLQIHYNVQFTHAQAHDEHVDVTYTDDQGQSITQRCRYLINAAGPWVNDALSRCEPTIEPKAIELVQGTHIELPGTLQQGIFYLEAPQDKRAIFAMPWYDRILFGTTEKLYRGDPAKVKPTDEEVNYLLQVYNHYFPGKPLTRTDVIASWAGARVLPASGSNPFSRSRETLLHPNRARRPNILSIYGGKLTSHHSTATKILRFVK